MSNIYCAPEINITLCQLYFNKTKKGILFMMFPITLSYKLTARSTLNYTAVFHSPLIKRTESSGCFSAVKAPREIKTMPWARVFQMVPSGDYG